MIFAGLGDSIFGNLCCGFWMFLVLIGFIVHQVGSAVGSAMKSDKVKEIGAEVAKSWLESYFNNLFR